MKRYLNKYERADIIKMLSLVGSAEEFSADWLKRGNITEDENLKIKLGVNNLYDALDLIMNRLDKDLKKQIYKEAFNSELMCLSKTMAEIKEKNFNEELKIAHVKRETLDIFALKTLELCNPCALENQDECELRKLFRELDIDPYDAEAAGCPYCIRKKRKRKKREVDE